MIDANDAFTLDWTNPTTHMVAGRDAGHADCQAEIERLEAENQDLLAMMEKLETTCEKVAADLELRRGHPTDILPIEHPERLAARLRAVGTETSPQSPPSAESADEEE